MEQSYDCFRLAGPRRIAVARLSAPGIDHQQRGDGLYVLARLPLRAGLFGQRSGDVHVAGRPHVDPAGAPPARCGGKRRGPLHPRACGRFVGDYVSTAFSSNGTVIPTFAAVVAPHDGLLDQALYSVAIAPGASTDGNALALDTSTKPATGLVARSRVEAPSALIHRRVTQHRPRRPRDDNQGSFDQQAYLALPMIAERASSSQEMMQRQKSA